MIAVVLVIFLVICLSIVSFVTVVCPLLTVGLAASAELSISLLSTAYFVLLFTTIFYSGQRMFLLFAFGAAVHFKQHSSLTYQNSSFFIGGGSRNHGIMDLRDYGIMELWKLRLYNELCGTSQQLTVNSQQFFLYALYFLYLKILLHYYITLLRTTDYGQQTTVGQQPPIANSQQSTAMQGCCK